MKKSQILIIAVLLPLFAAGCSGILMDKPAGSTAENPQTGIQQPAGNGNVAINFATESGLRTLFPTLPSGDFDKIHLEYQWTEYNVDLADRTQLNLALRNAYSAKAAIVPAASAATVPLGFRWAAQADIDTLNTAIGNAETLYASRPLAAAQSSVNTQVTALNNAITAFNGKTAAGTLDIRTQLKTTLQSAYQVKAGMFVQEAATLPTEAYSISQEKMDAFNNAIAAAEGKYKDTTALVADINDQLAALITATSTFTGSDGGAPAAGTFAQSVDRSALKAKIDDANAERGGVLKSDPTEYFGMVYQTAASKVPSTVQFVSTTQWTTFDNAVNAAQDALLLGSTNAAALASAVSTLDAAITVFKGQLASGTVTTNTVSRTTLKTALENAYKARTGVKSAANGADIANDANCKWVTTTVWNALNTAITTAETTMGSYTSGSNPSASTISTAATTLNNAVTTFNNGKSSGTFTVNRSALVTALGTAYRAKAGVIAGDNAALVPMTTDNSFVSTAAMNTFNAAIATAENLLKDTATAGMTTATFSAAATTLNNAVNTFNNAKTAGKFQINRDSLRAKIIEAYAARIGIKEAADGSAAGAGIWWATAATHTALKNAISEAEAILHTYAAAQTAVDGGVSPLNTAITTFVDVYTANGFHSYTKAAEDIDGNLTRAIITIPYNGKWLITAQARVGSEGIYTPILSGSAEVVVTTGSFSQISINLTTLVSGTLGFMDYEITGIDALPEYRILRGYGGLDKFGNAPANEMLGEWNYSDTYKGLVGQIPGYYGFRIRAQSDMTQFDVILADEIVHIYNGLTTYVHFDVGEIVRNIGRGIFTFNRPGDQSITWNTSWLPDAAPNSVSVTVEGDYASIDWFVDETNVTAPYLSNEGKTFTASFADLRKATDSGGFGLGNGPHHITAIVLDNGKYSSKRLYFTLNQ